jgi:hypothetical protein
MVIIVVKNQSTILSDAEIKRVIAALQIQLDRDLCPSWDLGKFHIEFREKTAAILKGERQFIFLDNVGVAGALGYHDVTVNGDAISYVGAKETMMSGGQWSVTASHEICEMCVNDHLNDTEYNEAEGRMYIKEVCDAVELDSQGYVINGVLVSDFVLPGWFQPDVKQTAPLSFCGHVTIPYELAAGGYISFIDLGQPDRGWQQVYYRNQPTKRPGTARGLIRERIAQLGAPRKSTAL